MKREYYSATIQEFCSSSTEEICKIILYNNQFTYEALQRLSWEEEINILKSALSGFQGHIFFEYSVPRMGKRIDVLLIIDHVIFILEFKVGEGTYTRSALDQVMDYALDLKNFHETSHELLIAPILIATKANTADDTICLTPQNDQILYPIKCNVKSLDIVIKRVLSFSVAKRININEWQAGCYSPTPTIIEAAISLYTNHSVKEITRTDASAKDLQATTYAIDEIISRSKTNKEKSICFITGVPGAGKTLVGLNAATQYLDKEKGVTSVFLSGNGPLVAILREALIRDKLQRDKLQGIKSFKKDASQEVKLFIQNVHHFRDEYLRDDKAPVDHVAIFDEAQRAWTKEMTASFMKIKKRIPDFQMSEPEFLISCLDRHKDWAVIICLVGGGQEINRGEAGIYEWTSSIARSFPHWKVYLPDNLTDSEYALYNSLEKIKDENITFNSDLHLSVSMRSFRAENLSKMVKCILDFEVEQARNHYNELSKNYPIILTRSLCKAKQWLKERARGSERFGVIVSSQAERLKPLAIDVKSPLNPVLWFLNDKDDVRSSYYLEDAATEFGVQGLELDWTCVTWDADFRYTEKGWDTYSFKGNKWERIIKEERKKYLKNAYRVLLTRARQGMVMVIPYGSKQDPTRKREYYDSTYNYLKEIGFETI